MLADSDIDRIRAAIAAYFRAAGALAEASMLIRLAAAAEGSLPQDPEAESEEAWLLDRATTYRDKSELMSRSGAVLLGHAWDWMDTLDEDEIRDQETSLADFARAVENAATGYAEVVEALTATPLSDTAAYGELLQELRSAVRFLQTEAGVFAEQEDDEHP